MGASCSRSSTLEVFIPSLEDRLNALPQELLAAIAEHLSDIEYRALRVASRHAQTCLPLRNAELFAPFRVLMHSVLCADLEAMGIYKGMSSMQMHDTLVGQDDAHRFHGVRVATLTFGGRTLKISFDWEGPMSSDGFHFLPQYHSVQVSRRAAEVLSFSPLKRTCRPVPIRSMDSPYLSLSTMTSLSFGAFNGQAFASHQMVFLEDDGWPIRRQMLHAPVHSSMKCGGMSLAEMDDWVEWVQIDPFRNVADLHARRERERFYRAWDAMYV